MKKLSFVFAILLVLVGVLSTDVFARSRCDGRNPPPGCEPRDPPPPPPPPLPFIPFSNVELGCSIRDERIIDMVLTANISGVSSVNSSAMLIIPGPSGHPFD